MPWFQRFLDWFTVSQEMPVNNTHEAHIYTNESAVYVCGNVYCTDGQSSPSLPVVSMILPPPNLELGEAVLRVLNAAPRELTPHEFDIESQKAIELLGVPDFNELERSYWYIRASLVENGTVISVMPLLKCAAGGYVSFTQPINFPADDAQAVGKKLNEIIANQDKSIYVEDESHT